MFKLHISIQDSRRILHKRHVPYFTRTYRTLEEALNGIHNMTPQQSPYHVQITITGAAEAPKAKGGAA